MRHLFAALIAFGAVAAAPMDRGMDRPGGAYVSLPAEDAAACAILCAEDGLCLAWSYRHSARLPCALKAVTPAAQPDPDAVSGLAPRANAFLALTQAGAPPAPKAPEAPRPPVASAPVPALRAHLPPPAAAPMPQSDADGLLGGL